MWALHGRHAVQSTSWRKERRSDSCDDLSDNWLSGAGVLCSIMELPLFRKCGKRSSRSFAFAYFLPLPGSLVYRWSGRYGTEMIHRVSEKLISVFLISNRRQVSQAKTAFNSLWATSNRAGNEIMAKRFLILLSHQILLLLFIFHTKPVKLSKSALLWQKKILQQKKAI